MRKTIYEPDMIIEAENYPSDKLEIFKGKKTIIFVAKVDGCGAVFHVDKSKLFKEVRGE